MKEFEWKIFLKEYNEELLSYEEIIERLPRELIEAGWLGYSGATEAELVATETRLNTTLPPSYRAFLKSSNGWRFPSVFIFDLLPAGKIAWFKERNQDWIDAYTGPSAGLPRISDKEYLVYGDEQDPCRFRTEYLQTALEVSAEGDSAIVLLNPKIVTPDGEWETWFFANWLPGAARYRCFGEWLADERRSCRKQFKPLPAAKVRKFATAKKPAFVKKAQAAARLGHTELALKSLESFASKGDDSAAASLAELYAFLGEWDKVITNAGRLIANPRAVYADNVFTDMVRLLGRAGHLSGEWARVTDVVKRASKSNASRSEELRRAQKDTIACDAIRRSEQRNELFFQNLINYAERQGNPPHELLAIFGVRHSMDDRSPEQVEDWYRNAVRNVDSNRPDLKNNPREKQEYFFSLAKDRLENEALRLYEAYGQSFGMPWQAAEYVAAVYVRRKSPEAAWVAIESKLAHWYPVDNAQVAPIILLTDEYLTTLMTPERCRFVLATPRGPEAVKTSK